ncbi:hapless 2-like [Ixodes scapularis]
MARFVLAVALAAVLNPAWTLTDIKMKAVLTSCDSHAYEPMAFQNSITNCQKKIQISLLVNNTALVGPYGMLETSSVVATSISAERFRARKAAVTCTSRRSTNQSWRGPLGSSAPSSFGSDRMTCCSLTLCATSQYDQKPREVFCFSSTVAVGMRLRLTVNGKVTETHLPEKSCNLSFCSEADKSMRPPRGYCCNCKSGGNCTVHCLTYSKLWYFVCVLGPPVIKQDTFVQLFVQSEHSNLSQRWQPLMDPPEELVLSAEHPLDSNSLNTVAASYLSEKAPEAEFVLKDYKTLRALIPYPNPGVPVNEMSSVFAGGSDNIMLIPNNMTKSSDVLECINDLSLFNMADHCHPMNKRCFEKEPYDIFLREDEKRRTGEFPPLLLSSYKKQLPESPILFNETSGEHFLAFFHAHSHLSLILLEINAENITLFKQGTNGRINVVSTRSSDSSSVVRVEAHNVGDTPAIFTALVTQCTHGVSNSDTSSAPVRPRRSILLLFVVQFGTLDIREDVRCTVELHDSEFGMIASRLVTLRPGKQCFCYLSCQCSCGNESLECHLINEADAVKAGIYKSRSARSSDVPGLIGSVGLLLTLVLVLMAAGFVKACLGASGYTTVANFGIRPCLYGKKRLSRYYESDIIKYPVQHDFEGYPVHPKTKRRTRVIGYTAEFFLNTFYFFIWPFLLYRERVLRNSQPSYQLLKSVRFTRLSSA